MRAMLVTVFATAVGSFGCELLFEDPHVPIGPVAGTDSDPRALTAYDEALAGWGAWSDDETLGTVWTPSDPTFVPYATHGRFVNIDGRIVWLSELPWGAATLHHGRWVEKDARWHWIPGLRYASAWVTWSHDGTTTSWSPAPPTVAWHNGVAVRVEPPEEPIVASIDDDALAIATRPVVDDDSEFVRRWLAPGGGW